MLATTSMASDAEARAALRRVLTLVLADDWGRRACAEQLLAQADICPRCGGDALRCWQCDGAAPAEDALRADFHRLAGELGGEVVEE